MKGRNTKVKRSRENCLYGFVHRPSPYWGFRRRRNRDLGPLDRGGHRLPYKSTLSHFLGLYPLVDPLDPWVPGVAHLPSSHSQSLSGLLRRDTDTSSSFPETRFSTPAEICDSVRPLSKRGPRGVLLRRDGCRTKIGSLRTV